MNAQVATMPQRRPHNLNGGRPDKIGQAHVDKANDWIANRLWERDGNVVPTIEGLARHLELARSQVYAADELKDTLEFVQALQSEMVLNKGLTNEFNATIAKLILSAKHGYVERTEVANTHELTSKPSEAIAQDFSAYVKNKTEAIEGTIASESQEQPKA